MYFLLLSPPEGKKTLILSRSFGKTSSTVRRNVKFKIIIDDMHPEEEYLLFFTKEYGDEAAGLLSLTWRDIFTLPDVEGLVLRMQDELDRILRDFDILELHVAVAENDKLTPAQREVLVRTGWTRHEVHVDE